MSEVKKLFGYDVKDETARVLIHDLENVVEQEQISNNERFGQNENRTNECLQALMEVKSDVLHFHENLNQIDGKQLQTRSDLDALSEGVRDIEEELIPSVEGRITPLEDAIRNMFVTIYPVGSIYMCFNEINPGNMFGGVWEQIKDRFLLASGDIYSAGSEGGEAEHVLTIEEMPEHRHNIYNQNEQGNMTIYDGYSVDVISPAPFMTYGARVNVGLEGENQPHNNMPPYMTVNVWKRIG